MTYAARQFACAFQLLVMLGGCTALNSRYDNLENWNSTNPFQPNADGAAATVGAIATIPNLHLAYSSRQTGAPGAFGPGVARFNGLVLEAFSADGDLSPVPTASSQPGYFLRTTSSVSSDPGSGLRASHTGGGATDSLIAWGVWLDTTATLIARDNPVGLGRFHYVIGQKTPGLPQSGVARYSLFSVGTVSGGDSDSGTASTSDSGTGRAQYATLREGQLSVLWGGTTPKIGLDLIWRNFVVEDASASGDIYQMRTTGGVTDPASSQLSLRPGTATFGGALTTFPVCPQGSTCSATVEGFFAGPAAERAGLAYEVVDRAPNEPDSVISGVAAFTFSDFIVPPAPPAPVPGVTLLDQTNPTAFAMAFAASGAGALPASVVGPPATATQAADGQLNTFSFTTGSPGQHVDVQRGTTSSPAAETGGDSLITWGRWTGGTRTGTTIGTSTLNANQGFHYVVGAATPPANIPPANPGPSGMATFTLMGATKPTFGDGALAPGTFTGNMAVQWGGAASTKVGVDFTIAMPGDTSYRLTSTGGVATPASSQITTSGGSSFAGQLSTLSGTVTVTGGTGRACPAPPCFANVNGFFAGLTAQRAGVVYDIGTISTTAIQGAAAFTR